MAATSAGLMSVMAITSAVAGTAGAIVNGIQNYSANHQIELHVHSSNVYTT